MIAIRHCALSFAYLAALVLCASARGVTVVENVTLISMESGVDEQLAGRSVVVRDGYISEVGPTATIEPPPGARVIDGTGKFLVPGLVDMHVHIKYEDELIRFLAYGVTSVRNMSGRPSHLRYRKEIANGTRAGPTIYSAATTIDSAPILFPGTTEVSSGREAAQAVRAAERAGWDYIKVYDSLSRESYQAIIETASVPVVGHVPFAVGLEGALASGQHTIEHLFGYGSWLQSGGPVTFASRVDRTRAWTTIDTSRIPEAVRLTVESGVWNCPTLTLWMQLTTAEELERAERQSFVDYSSQQQIEDWRALVRRMGPATKSLRSANDVRLEIVGALHSAGARIVAGTDTGMPFIPAGQGLHWELEHFVTAGFSPYEALASATRNAAECLGAEDFGTIAAEKRADLVLLEKDPLEDIRNVSSIAGVMTNGHWISAEAIGKALERLAARRK